MVIWFEKPTNQTTMAEQNIYGSEYPFYLFEFRNLES